MSPEEVLAEIGEDAHLDAIRPHWAEAMAECPAGPLSFLSDGEIALNWKWSGFRESLPESVREAARLTRNDAALSAFAWYSFWRIYRGPDSPQTGKFPSLKSALGAHCGEFYLLQAMAMVPLVRERHRRLGIPEDVTRETCLQIMCHCGNYRRAHDGRYGVCRRQAHWHGNYVKRLLFRLGRFEYMTYEAPGAVEVYRNRKSRQALALAADGAEVSESGQVAREPDMPRAWTATLEHTDNTVTGYPVSPRGYIIHRKTRLPRAEWDCVLKKGDSALQMHIPAGGGMDQDACRESLRKAPAFFHRHFPEHPVAAIICNSWIFNTQLQEILSPDANLARLQREVYLFPVASGPTSGLWFIFLQDNPDPRTAPRETSLQRAILDFISGGNAWRAGGMFVLADDVEHLGTRHYLSNFENGA